MITQFAGYYLLIKLKIIIIQFPATQWIENISFCMIQLSINIKIKFNYTASELIHQIDGTWNDGEQKPFEALSVFIVSY